MRHTIDYIKKYKLLLLIILPAFFLYMLLIFPSGTFFCFKKACGINFWGVHGHDGIWHLAIANSSFNKFPFVAPTFAGEALYGYNFLLDFIIFLLSKIGLSSFLSYFKILPVFWFITFTFLLVILARKIKDSPVFVGIFLFLNYFAGSFSYLLTLYHDNTIKGSSTLLPQPIMHMMSNLPYAFSLLPLLLILILLKDKKISTKKIFLIGSCLFLIMGLKFYGGMISIFLVFTHVILASVARPESLSFTPEVKLKKNHSSTSGVLLRIKYLFIICLFIITSIFLFYDPIRSFKTGSVFGFAPFALVHTITETPNQFYLRDLTDARYYILAQGRIGPRFVWIEAINLSLFLFFYLGTRFFAFFYIGFLALKRKLDKFDLSVILTILFSILLTVTLVQKAEWWNTIQFFFYAIFLLTIYLSQLTYELIFPLLSFQRTLSLSKGTEKSNKTKTLIKTKVSGFIIGLIILILSNPTSLDLVNLFAVYPGATYLPKDEIEALNFLKKQPDGVVLTSLYDEKWKNFQLPNPLFAYADTAYISAFSGKQVYLANILQLRLTGVPYEKRLERMKKMDCTILQEANYIYELRRLPDEKKMAVKCKPENLKKLFNNGSVNIYSLKK